MLHSKIKMKHILILLFISFTFANSNIICPDNVDSYSCLTLIVNNQTNSTCEVQKCFKWDNAECISTGKEQTSALILQSVPFTGIFGAGFGNISRWDLFGVSMGLFFGICLFLCCTIFAGFFFCSETSTECLKCYTNCGGCIYSLIVMIWWIYGIVLIANREILDGNGCQLK